MDRQMKDSEMMERRCGYSAHHARLAEAAMSVLRASGLIGSKHQRRQTYGRCFVGRDAVGLLVDRGLAMTRTLAVALCQRLMARGEIEHVKEKVQEQRTFRDGPGLYRVCKHNVASRGGAADASVTAFDSDSFDSVGACSRCRRVRSPRSQSRRGPRRQALLVADGSSRGRSSGGDAPDTLAAAATASAGGSVSAVNADVGRQGGQGGNGPGGALARAVDTAERPAADAAALDITERFVQQWPPLTVAEVDAQLHALLQCWPLAAHLAMDPKQQQRIDAQ